MKEISAIIPNYNSGKYIDKCLKALINQEYEVREIIVIDDCSTDESVEIVKEYVKKNKKIKLSINEKNMGVSYSRNKGISMATSEYLMFCDGDDWYELDATKKMVQALEEYNADYIVACYNIAKSENEKIAILYDSYFQEGEISKKECIAFLPITSSAKLIKKSIITENGLQYPEGIKNCEELPIIPIAAMLASKVVYIRQAVYNYYQREKSASNRKIDNLDFFDITYQLFKEKILPEYEIELLQRMAEHLMYGKTLTLIKNKANKKEITTHLNKCIKELEGSKIKNIIGKFPIRKKLFLYFARYKIIFPLRMYVKLQEKILTRS